MWKYSVDTAYRSKLIYEPWDFTYNKVIYKAATIPFRGMCGGLMLGVF